LNPVSVFACESQPIVLAGLARLLAQQEDLDLIGAARNLPDTKEQLSGKTADVILLDQSLGLKSLFQFVNEIKITAPSTQSVLWISDMAEMDCFRALQMGVRGVLKKTGALESVLECIRTVQGGEVWMEGSANARNGGEIPAQSMPRLTPREREIVQLICEGMKNKEVADQLGITPGTVKVHLMHIFEKTGVKDRFELAVSGRRMLGTTRTGVLTAEPVNTQITLINN
jgi:DNA-binding NarL/FixJ family response regulator